MNQQFLSVPNLRTNSKKKDKIKLIEKHRKSQCVFYQGIDQPLSGFNTKSLRSSVFKDANEQLMHPLNYVGTKDKKNEFIPFINERDEMGNLILEKLTLPTFHKPQQSINSTLSSFHKCNFNQSHHFTLDFQQTKDSKSWLDQLDRNSTKGIRPKYESRLCSILGIDKKQVQNRNHIYSLQQERQNLQDVIEIKFKKQQKQNYSNQISILNNTLTANQNIISLQLDLLLNKNLLKLKQSCLIVRQKSKQIERLVVLLKDQQKAMKQFINSTRKPNCKQIREYLNIFSAFKPLVFDEEINHILLCETIRDYQKLLLKNKSSSQRRNGIIFGLTYIRKFRLSFLLIIPAIETLSELLQ